MKITLRELQGTSPGFYLLLAALLALIALLGLERSGSWNTMATSSQA
jgi:hypothetical protein